MKMIEHIFESFAKKRVLVIGDVMIDAYLVGQVSRISPEAPVPIVDICDRKYCLGGAANVALNIAALHAQPILCSVIGDDEKAGIFFDLMDDKNLDTQAIIKSKQRKTTIKYRVIGNKLQMLRIDEENKHLLNEIEQQCLLQKVKELIDNQYLDAIIFEDYDKGVLSRLVIQTIVEWARINQIPVLVDPKKRNFHNYQGVTLFKPNLKELKDGLHDEDQPFALEMVEELMKKFALEYQIRYVFTTLSEKGIVLYDSENDKFISQPAYLRKISDVSGAGDTVISVATLCMLAGLPIDKTAYIANLAGGIVCEYSGVQPIPLQQLKDEILQHNLL